MRAGRLAALALVAGLASVVSCRKAAEPPAAPPKEPETRAFVYRVKLDDVAAPDKADVLARTVKLVQARVGKHGSVESQGEDRLVVKLPLPVTRGDIESLDEAVTTRGMLRFSLTNDNPEDMQAARRGKNVPDCTPFLPERDPKTGEIIRDAPSSANEIGRIVRWRKATYEDLKKLPAYISDGEWYLVENTARVTGEFLGSVEATQSERGDPVIGFKFEGKGRRDFEELTDRCKRTDEHPGRRLAIIVDDELYSAPEINSRISSAGIITGKFTKREVENLVNVLRAGQLPAPVERVPAAEPGK